MPKPNGMPNKPNPERSVSSDLADVMSVGSGSRQNPATAQTSMNPNRMKPAMRTADYRSEIDPNGIENRQSDRTEWTKETYRLRNRIFNKAEAGGSLGQKARY